MARFKFNPAPKPHGVTAADWMSWIWQLRNGLVNEADFGGMISLSIEERHALQLGQALFHIRSTPYYTSLVGHDQRDPLRRILLPQTKEITPGNQQMLDPLGEIKNTKVPRVVHRYSDRVLFLVTDFCSVYCRYCTRKHFTGNQQVFPQQEDYQKGLDYIRRHAGIREVILSGGDPLTLSDEKIDQVLKDLRKIEHVEIIRIGSRMPVVAPMRITQKLVEIMRSSGPVFLMTHFNHPREITLEAAESLAILVDHGIPVFNQMVLLNGVNNHPAIVQALSRRLLYLRVKPYYMFQCDPSLGTDHLRTSIDDSLQIQKELWGHLSGLAMPTYAIDIPDGGGKTVMAPNFLVERHALGRVFEGWDGVRAEYLDPHEAQKELPLDMGEYIQEWELLKSRALLS